MLLDLLVFVFCAVALSYVFDWVLGLWVRSQGPLP